MLKLKRLKIDKYRRVIPGTELHFDDGMNVLLGKNGSGKTTLLNLLSMCLRSDFSELKEEEFALEYEMQLNAGTVCICIQNQSSARRALRFMCPRRCSRRL